MFKRVQTLLLFMFQIKNDSALSVCLSVCQNIGR